jgi:hypothetical protein
MLIRVEDNTGAVALSRVFLRRNIFPIYAPVLSGHDYGRVM